MAEVDLVTPEYSGRVNVGVAHYISMVSLDAKKLHHNYCLVKIQKCNDRTHDLALANRTAKSSS